MPFQARIVLTSLLVAASQGGTSSGDGPTRVEANTSAEVRFESKGAHADPFNDVRLDVVFRTPAGRSLRVPAFWAGGKAWKVRYASGEVGVHAYRSESSEPSLDGVAGAVEVARYSGDNPLFRHGPIRIADDGRHFAHADGTPFFWLGDTWWMGLCHRLRWPDEFARLADDRAAKGFNVVQIVAGLYPDMPPFDPRGANEAGFPWEADYARIRPEYFDMVDRRLQALVDRGITPCVVGMWGYFLPWMGEARAEAHWRHVIARYGSWPVVWCVAGEANLPWYLAKGFPYDDREVVKGWTRVMAKVRATDPFRRPLTIHPTALNMYTSRHATDDPALLDFDMLQTPHGRREAAVVALKAAADSRAATPRMPVVDGEASYERLMDNLPTEWTRAMFWICMAEGAAGHTYGANGIWQCNRRERPHGASPTGGSYGKISWDEAMVLPGSGQLGAGKRFLETLPWARFEPHREWVAAASEESGPVRIPVPGRWIWHPGGDATRNAEVGPRFFRRVFDVPPGRSVRNARLAVGADDLFEARINVRVIVDGNGWAEPVVVDAKSALRPGRNVLAIRAENAPGPVGMNPAGLIAGLEVELDEGPPIRVETDARWRSSAAAPVGWAEPDFDDSAWAAAVEMGAAGIAPWGAVKPRVAPTFPPLSAGVPGGGPRFVYALDPTPLVLLDLTPDRSYILTEFDPVAGLSGPAQTLRSDAQGRIRVAPPAHGRDRVLSLIPAGAP